MGDTEKRVLAFIGNNPKGVSVTEIKKELPQQNMQDIVSALNHLIMQELITLYELPKQPGDKHKRLIYKINTASNVEGLRCADNEEKVVYRIIEESGNKGIWVREIRIKANLALLALNKVIKSLENKKMIKSVKTVTAGKKKVYMLYNLEPDRSLTGGAWYSDQDFESDFVDALNQGCYRILKQKRDTAKKLAGGPLAVNNHSYASVTDVCKYINELGLSKIPLSDDDIKQILTTLLYDGKVERKLVAGNELFKAVEPFLPSPGFVRTTCGVCPVFRNCEASCTINPKSCSYLTDWLS